MKEFNKLFPQQPLVKILQNIGIWKNKEVHNTC